MPVTRATRGIALMLLAMLAFASNDTFMKMLLVNLPLPQALVVRGVPAVMMLGFLAWRAGALPSASSSRTRCRIRAAPRSTTIG